MSQRGTPSDLRGDRRCSRFPRRRVLSSIVVGVILAGCSPFAAPTVDTQDVSSVGSSQPTGASTERGDTGEPAGTGATGTGATAEGGDVASGSVENGSVPSEGGSATTGPDEAADEAAGAAGSGAVPTIDSTIEWQFRDDETDTARIEVPVDYDNPSGEKFSLFLARHRATDETRRIGSLLVNPGGPGFGGTSWAFYAVQNFSPELVARFDIVSWDPRGTGESTPAIDCTEDYDRFFTSIDGTPETPADRTELIDKAKEFTAECETKNAGYVEFVGTNNSARDIDQIRQALGEQKISYFGFSYGSELGATWATLFPDTVRAAVLDGASDPNATDIEAGIQQMTGFQRSLETFLADCKSRGCAFSGNEDPTTVYSDLMVQLDATPLVVDENRPPVNRDVATGAVIEAMYSDRTWPALDRSLAAAKKGDGSGLLALYDKYFQRRPDGTYSNALEAFQVITCADTPERETPEVSDANVDQIRAVAPLLVPTGSVSGYQCNFFAPSVDPRIDITGAGAGPILVVGTTGDPSTPLESSKKMAAALEDGILVVADANQHTGYGTSKCMVELVDNYLINLTLPDDDTICK